MIEDGLKLSSYFGERQRTNGRFFSDVLLDLFQEEQVATSAVLRAAGGFGLRHHLRTDETLTMSEDPSVLAMAVDRRERIEALVPRVLELQPQGMLTVERVRILDQLDPGAPTELPESLREAARFTVHLGRRARHGGAPAYLAVCELFHRRGLAGASVLLGVDGTSRGRRQRAGFFDANAAVPTVLLAVGDGARMQAVLPELATLLDDPVITVERVRVCKRDGELAAQPPRLPERDGAGLGLWQKLMVYTSEAHLHHGQPLHRALVRELRATGAEGLTTLRGVWGFHGEHAPHGDRFFQLGRRVPVVTVLVDSPDRIARSFEVVDRLTSEHGLVTAEMVPARAHVEHGRLIGGLRLGDHDY